MSVKMRQEVERKIAAAFITAALAAGYTINIHNGGSGPELPQPSSDKEVILAAMFATDDEHLMVYKDGKQIGWVYFVYGNSGWDVISDYSTNLGPLMAEADKISEMYQ